MARLTLAAGETKTLVAAGGKPVTVTKFLITTDGTNDSVLQLADRDGFVFPGSGFKVTGTDDHGGATRFNEDIHANKHGPATASLSGTGSAAKIYYKEKQ